MGSTVGVYGQARASSRPAPASRSTPLDDALRPKNRGLRNRERLAWWFAGALPGSARGGHVAVGDVSVRRDGCLWAAGGFGEGGAVGGRGTSWRRRERNGRCGCGTGYGAGEEYGSN